MLACFKTRRKIEAIRTLPDGRQKCITESGWQRRRKEVYEREQGLCEKCMTYASAPQHRQSIRRARAPH
jgi:hypothetical protein